MARKPYKHLSESELQQAFSDFQAGQSLSRISCKLNVPEITLARNLRKSFGEIEISPYWSRTLFLPDDQAVLAYIAGLIDGEGHVKISRSPNSASLVRIEMTDEPIIRWLSSFGGRFYISKKVVKPNHKQSYCWEIARQRDVTELLNKTMPYLRIKKQISVDLLLFLQRSIEERRTAIANSQYFNMRSNKPEHGDRRAYTSGCRCDLCRIAQREFVTTTKIKRLGKIPNRIWVRGHRFSIRRLLRLNSNSNYIMINCKCGYTERVSSIIDAHEHYRIHLRSMREEELKRFIKATSTITKSTSILKTGST